MCLVAESEACFFVCQAEDGIRDLVRSRGLGDVYKRQYYAKASIACFMSVYEGFGIPILEALYYQCKVICSCLLYTSDAADERSSVDLGGRRIIKKKKNKAL